MDSATNFWSSVDFLRLIDMFVKTAAAGMVATDVNGVIWWCNDKFSEANEKSKDELIGSRLGDRITYPRGMNLDDRMQRAAERGYNESITTTLITKNGNKKIIHQWLYRLDNAHGNHIGFWGIGYELTTEKNLIDDSKAAIRVLNEMREEEIREKQLEVIDMLKAKGNALCPKENPRGKCCPAILAVEESLVKGQPSLKALLTNAELRVAKYVKQGMPTKKISHKIGISERTVKNHRFAIRKKLNISQTNIALTNYLQSYLV